MTKEERDLLVKDLCARLPYGVKVAYLGDSDHTWYNLESIDITDDEVYISTLDPYYTNKYVSIESIKPYLFPVSSMTEEQMKELVEMCDMYSPADDYDPIIYRGISILYKHVNGGKYKVDFNIDTINWFLKNHFDCGLLEKDMAIDCTNLNIY